MTFFVVKHAYHIVYTSIAILTKRLNEITCESMRCQKEAVFSMCVTTEPDSPQHKQSFALETLGSKVDKPKFEMG